MNKSRALQKMRGEMKVLMVFLNPQSRICLLTGAWTRSETFLNYCQQGKYFNFKRRNARLLHSLLPQDAKIRHWCWDYAVYIIHILLLLQKHPYRPVTNQSETQNSNCMISKHYQVTKNNNFKKVGRVLLRVILLLFVWVISTFFL